MNEISQEFSNYLENNNLLSAYIKNIDKYSHYKTDFIDFINTNWYSESIIVNEDILRMSFIGDNSIKYVFTNRKEVSQKEANNTLLTFIASRLIKMINVSKDLLNPADYLNLATIGIRSIGIYDLDNLTFTREWRDEGIADFSNSFENLQWSERLNFTKIQVIYFLLTAFEEKSNVEIFKVI